MSDHDKDGSLPRGGASSNAKPDRQLIAETSPALPTPNSMKRKPHLYLNKLWAALHTLKIGKVSLDENSMIAEARKATGLYYFGDESFIEPMRHVLYCLKHESKTNPAGDFFTRQNIVRLLKNRLFVL